MSANQTQYSFKILEQDLSLSVDHFKIENLALATDYSIRLQARHGLPLFLSGLIGQTVCLTLFGTQGPNYFHGIIVELQSIGVTPDNREHVYIFLLHSPLYPLKLNFSNRVFLNKSIIEIAHTLLKNIGLDDYHVETRLQTNYSPLNIVTQIDETDYDFFYRTLAHAGVFYFFQQDENQFKLIIIDSYYLLNDVATTLMYQPLNGMIRTQESVFNLYKVAKALTQKIILRDYNPNYPELTLESESKNFSVIGAGTHYYYGENYQSQQESENLLQIRQQALNWQRNIFFIETDCPTLQVGQQLTISDCPISEFNGDFRVISLEHFGNQEAGKIFAADLLPTYHNKAMCIPTNIAYRPIPADKKIAGMMLAHVESNDDDACLDDQGNYRIRFPFDLGDSPIAQASCPVRLMQPYSGENFGFHFPLRNGTEVLCSFENGDPTRPILLGALANPYSLSPVTAENVTQHRLRTKSGNELCMDDQLGQANTQLFTQDKQHLLHLSARDDQHQIQLATMQGKMSVQAKQNFMIQTGQDWTHNIGKDHHVIVESQCQTDAGKNIEWNVNHDAKFTAKQNISMTAEQNSMLQSGQDMRCDFVQGAQINASQSMIIATNNFYLSSDKSMIVGATGVGDIVLAQAGALATIKNDGSVLLKAKQINIYSQQNNLAGTEGHFGGEGQAAQVPTIQNGIAIKIEYRYADGSEQGKAMNDVLYNAVGGKDLLPYFGKTDQQGNSIVRPVSAGTFTVNNIFSKHICSPEFIAVEHQGKFQFQPPWCQIKFDIPDGFDAKKEPDSAHTFIVTALSPPIVKNYCTVGDEKLTEEELNYFKTNGNNATIFIHGYNIPQGGYSQQIFSVLNFTGKADDFQYTELKQPATTYRNLKIIQELFPEYRQVSFTSADEELRFNEALNGNHSHNWFLHMEDNLNTATDQFSHQDYRKYTRIINMIWKGNSWLAMDYYSVIDEAIKAGKRLVTLIQQLVDAGIEVNIIAHSLGNAVLVNAMEALALNGNKNSIAHAFLWDASIPNDIFSGKQINDPKNPWYLPNAADAAEKITILYSLNDNILGPIPPGQLNQAEINHTKPPLELIPAIFLNTLELESIYEAAMWIGTPVTHLLNPKYQKSIYNDWIKHHCDKFGNPFPATFEEQMQKDSDENEAFYTDLQAKLIAAKPKIHRQLEEANIGWKRWKVELEEYAAEHLDAIGFTISSVLGKTVIEINSLLNFVSIQGAITLYNTIFNDTEFRPTPALGYWGPDWNKNNPNDPIQKLINQGKMIRPVNQTPCLWSHSGMKIPSKELMESVYKKYIINKTNGISHFGKYPILG